MSKWNKHEKAEIAAREQREAVLRRKLFAVSRGEGRAIYADDKGNHHDIVNIIEQNETMRKINNTLVEENKRLKGIDEALKDFNREKQREQESNFADEGFEQVVTSRQKRSHI